MSKAGKKRKSGHRDACGQLKRATTVAEREGQIKLVAISARRRIFGLSADDADRVEGGSVIGRLYLAGHLVTYQLQAALRYEEIVEAANRAILARGYPSPGDLNRTYGGHDSDEGDSPEYIAKCRGATEAANRVWRCLRDCGEPLARYAIECAIADDHLMSLALAQGAPIMVGEIRIGCNAVARTLRLQIAA